MINNINGIKKKKKGGLEVLSCHDTASINHSLFLFLSLLILNETYSITLEN